MIDYKALSEYWEQEAFKARKEIKYWMDLYNQQKDMVERLSLDLGLREQKNDQRF